MTRPVRCAVYNRFWHSQGGGERHSGKVAELLSLQGHEVDLLGHVEVDVAELGDHLGLDLSRCRLRLISDTGDLEVERATADYDLLVNGSYMSRVLSRATRSAYLCYFPTPFDADMTAWQKRLARVVGPHVRRHTGGFLFGRGWYPREGGRRRRWSWSSGDGRLVLPEGGVRVLRFDLGRPGIDVPTEVTISTDAGAAVAVLPVTSEFRSHRVRLPASPRGLEVRFTSPVEPPPPGDDRELGIAVSRVRVENSRYGPREYAAYRYPWLLREADNLAFLSAYDVVMANSEYTRGWVQRLWGVDADVLYPPIQVARLDPAPVREKVVLSVGRFFAPGLGHAKRQLEMVQAFGQAVRSGALPEGWSMHVVGGCEPSQKEYLRAVREAGEGLPVVVTPNAPRSTVEQLLQTSSVFWSATGLGEDEDAAPWAQEHFGMTTVEAMAGGCVPVVIDRAGQREIVREDVDGYRWSTLDELVALTAKVAGDEQLRARLAASSVERAHSYDEDAFAAQWAGIVERHRLLP